MSENNFLNDYFEENRKGWNKRTGVHIASDFYDVESFIQGKSSLQSIELNELKEVNGKKLLHLQCHFGQDTISWAREGAVVTGVDFSDEAIRYANELALKCDVDARFISCNIYDLPSYLKDTFDIVFTSYGVIGWLPDLDKWARIISGFLKPGGTFYIAEFHPVVWMMDDNFEKIGYDYFNTKTIITEQTGTYASVHSPIQYTEYSWNHSLSETVNSLINNNLRIICLNEYPYSPHKCFKDMIGEEGRWTLQNINYQIPMVFTIKAEKDL